MRSSFYLLHHRNLIAATALLFALSSVVLNVVWADLLCRNCGHTVTTASALRNVKSEEAIESWNLTVLGVDTLVQSFRNSAPETFNVITVNGADLKFAGKAHAEETWFPGMSWRTCVVCSACNSHIGWYFQSPKDDFVGLVLDYLISSEYADTLIKVPLPRHHQHHHSHHALLSSPQDGL